MKNYLIFPIATILCTGLARSAVTYVDADVTGNTTLADGTALVANSVGYSTSTGADSLWALRSFGNGTSILEGGISENSPRLRTTIGSLTVGDTYEIYAYFWGAGGTSPSGLWRGRTSLTDEAGDLPGYNTVHFSGSSFTPMTAVTSVSRGDALNLDTLSTADGSGLENGGYFTSTSILTEESDRRLYQVSLGQVTVDGSGSVNVYIDDLADTAQGNRTWYDGVGYELTTASPAGDINYVDASASNVTRWDNEPFAPAAEGNVTIDDNWEERAFGNNSLVYESNADGAEDAPLLVTTLTGLTPNTDYVLYAYFWHDGRDWRLKASAKASDIDDNGTPTDLSDDFLPSSPLTNFSSTGSGAGTATQAPIAMGTDFATSPLTTQGNRTLRQASLGRTSSDELGNLKVYIDDLANSGEGNRIWFDGIGYKEAIALDPAADEDSDTLTNAEEETAGTDPYLVDTDGDSFSDATELTAGSDPLDANSVPPLPGNAIAIAPDGVWTWFNDERAIWHLGKLYAGYVMSDGQYGISQYDPATNTSSLSIISTSASREQDDHNNPSITVLPDNKLLIVYSKHITDDNFYHRTSLVTEPATSADWGPEEAFDTSAGFNGPNNTYSNTYLLSGESNRIYNFHRNINFNPTITISETLGATWETPIPFISVGSGNVRPYPRYCSNGTDRIDLIYTDGHPRDLNNSVYHMYYQGDAFYKTNGDLLDTFENLPLEHGDYQNPALGQKGSVIYQYSSSAWGAGDGPDDWIPNGRGWTWDVHYGTDGNPVCVFQVQVDNVTGSGWNNDRIYYYYARWTGTEWQRRFIAHAGRGLYSSEDDYGGGMSIDPDNPNVVYISSNAAVPFDLSNINNVPLAANDRYEVYRGVTADGGLTFNWEALTSNSPADNLRPVVPANHGYDKHAVWFFGTYNSYTSFDCQVLSLMENELVIETSSINTGSATLQWKSSPGRRYRIAGSLDLMSFPYSIASGIDSQGNSTSHSFPYPTPMVNSSKGFLIVAEE